VPVTARSVVAESRRSGTSAHPVHLSRPSDPGYDLWAVPDAQGLQPAAADLAASTTTLNPGSARDRFSSLLFSPVPPLVDTQFRGRAGGSYLIAGWAPHRRTNPAFVVRSRLLGVAAGGCGAKGSAWGVDGTAAPWHRRDVGAVDGTAAPWHRRDVGAVPRRTLLNTPSLFAAAALSLPLRRYNRVPASIGGRMMRRSLSFGVWRRLKEVVFAAARAPAKPKPRASKAAKTPALSAPAPAALALAAVRTIIGVDPDVGGAIAVSAGVTLRARWVTLRARWVTLRARWVTLRARWVTLRARWVTLRARWVTLRARWVTLRAR
jgi:hypothetical protein